MTTFLVHCSVLSPSKDPSFEEKLRYLIVISEGAFANYRKIDT